MLLPSNVLIQRMFSFPGPVHPPRVIKADLLQTLSCGTNGVAFADSALRQPFVLIKVSNAQLVFISP